MPCPCHLENRRKYACAGRSAQLVLSVLLLIVALSLTKDAVARITTSSNSLSFGSVTVGTSLDLGVTLTNVGFRPETVSQATVTGAGFSISGLVLPLTLNAGQNATFNVEFAPAVGGSVTGAISIITNAWWNPTISISLSGTGVAQPTANLSPPSMTFASQALGTTSSAQAVTLTNSGGTTLNFTSIALTGTNASDFAQTNTCGSSLAAGANCTIVVMFTPSVAGTEAASLSIADNSSGSPQTVSLSGAGTHDVILSWTASTTAGVVGYNVYRGTTSGGESATPLNSSPINGTTYSDETVQAGQTYYYVVTAVASDDGTQSAYSNQTSSTVPSP